MTSCDVIVTGPNPNRGRDDDFDSDTSETFPSRRLQHPQAQQHNKDRVRQQPQQRVRQPMCVTLMSFQILQANLVTVEPPYFRQVKPLFIK